MRNLVVLTLALGGASFLSAQTITEVGPAASYIPTGLPGGGIAQGSFFYIKGTALGPATGTVFTGPAAYTIGITLAGTRVRVTVGATTVDALPYYTSAVQVNAILPSNTPIGSGTVTVIYNGGQAVFPVTVVRAAFGIFTLNSAGTGPAVVTDAITYQVKTYTTALHPGDIATVWGTGLGPVNFPDSQPAQLVDLSNGVSALVGGRPATVQFAGRAPGYSGLDQLNIVIPNGVTGCAVPLVVQIGGASSNFTSVPIAASGNTCSDPNLTAADLSSAQAGSLAVGSINLSRTNTSISISNQTITTLSDTASGAFLRFDFNSLIRTSQITTPPPGTCSVNVYRGQSTPTAPVLPTYLDAGAKLTLSGGGITKDLTKSNGLYSVSGTTSTFPPQNGGFLSPGTYTITGPGGADVGAFSVTIALPSALVWTNQASITAVPRNQNLNITWSGGAATDLVSITGVSFDQTSSATGYFICYANASAGSFTVPSYVLSALPISSVTQGVGTGALYVGNVGAGVRFNANGLNYGIATYNSSNFATVNYQ